MNVCCLLYVEFDIRYHVPRPEFASELTKLESRWPPFPGA
jgi:hypothetical protein